MKLNWRIKKDLVDRARWPKGEWDEEPLDFVAWNSTYSGYRCWLSRDSRGHWCGYVGVPISHPLSGDESCYASVPCVNGGITYSGAKVFENSKGKATSGWCLGFDCNQVDDLQPASRFGEGTYRNLEYAIDQAANLCEYLYAEELTAKIS